MAKIRKKTLRKVKPVLKATRNFGEIIGEMTVRGEKTTRKLEKDAGKFIKEVSKTISEKGKEIVKTTEEVAPVLVKELSRGVKTGVKKAKKRR